MNRRGLKEASRQCIRDACYSTKTITLVCLLSILVLTAAEWGLTTLVQRFNQTGHYLSQTLSAGTRNFIIIFLISLVCQLLLILLLMGYASFSLKLSRRESFSLSVLMDGFRLWGRAVLLYLMTSVMLSLWASVFSLPVSYLFSALYMSGTIDEAAVFQLLLGYTALIMFIFSYRYRMAWFILLDQPELPTRQVLYQAKSINRVHRGRLFLMDLSFLPWLLLSVLTCGILLIWKLPYITATYAHAYNYMLKDYAVRQKRLQELLEQQRTRLEQNRF